MKLTCWFCYSKCLTDLQEYCYQLSFGLFYDWIISNCWKFNAVHSISGNSRLYSLCNKIAFLYKIIYSGRACLHSSWILTINCGLFGILVQLPMQTVWVAWAVGKMLASAILYNCSTVLNTNLTLIEFKFMLIEVFFISLMEWSAFLIWW